MLRTAEAESYGAVTIVNAMATGKGAALGIKLWTRATVTITDQAGVFRASNLTEPKEGGRLAEATAERVFARFGANRRMGAVIQTRSDIPIAVGLKSSSAASNAVALASLRALGRRATDLEVVGLGVDASLKTRVTLTGAFDDACASYFGGLIITDNRKRKILKRFKPKGNLRVLIHVPNRKKYTRDVRLEPFKAIKPFVQAAHQEALRGAYWNALTINGLIYSLTFDYDPLTPAVALHAGAIAAGLTGKGPAVAAVVKASKRDEVRAAWRQINGRVIDTSLNFQKARAWRVTS